MSLARDRFGLLWRRELAAQLPDALPRIDVLQLIAEDWLRAPAPWLLALRSLGARVPLHLHGVSLGPASASPVDPARADAIARLVGALRPERWSEHLAFVRSGGVEIGHLAAPPRSHATLEGTRRNVARLRQAVGAPPELENVATLIDPPGSESSETAWLSEVSAACDAPLLLDLHNLYANAVNFGLDPVACLDALPLGRVRTVHVAGGRRVRGPGGAERILDDHGHAVPVAVHHLLHELGARASQPLDVILEREVHVPPIAELLVELDALRAALASGRRRRTHAGAA